MKKLELTTKAIMLTVLTFNFLLLTFNSQAQVAPTPNSPGSGNCLEFDGVDDYVDLPDLNNLNFTAPATISFWFNSNLDQGHAIFNIGSNTTTNKLTIKIGEATASLINELITINRNTSTRYGYTTTQRTEVFDGNWHSIAVVMDGTITTIYLDGSSVPITVGAGSNNGRFGGLGLITNISIGSQVNLGVRSVFVDGQIDEVRVWNIARTQAQIRDNMCQTLNPALEPNLVGYWTFDDDPESSCGGTVLNPMTCDDSGNGNNGALN